jgi:hypothetical protein
LRIKLRATKLLTKSPPFYGTLRFTALFTAAYPFSQIHSDHALLYYVSNKLTLSTPKWYVPHAPHLRQVSAPKSCTFPPHSCHLPCPTHLISFHHSHYIRLAVQYHSPPNYAIPPTHPPNVSPSSAPILQHHQPMLLPQCDRPNIITTIQKIRTGLIITLYN